VKRRFGKGGYEQRSGGIGAPASRGELIIETPRSRRQSPVHRRRWPGRGSVPGVPRRQRFVRNKANPSRDQVSGLSGATPEAGYRSPAPSYKTKPISESPGRCQQSVMQNKPNSRRRRKAPAERWSLWEQSCETKPIGGGIGVQGSGVSNLTLGPDRWVFVRNKPNFGKGQTKDNFCWEKGL